MRKINGDAPRGAQADTLLIMQFIDLLSPDRVISGADAASKKRVLELISDKLATFNDKLDARAVMEALCAREKLGSTALGHGVAIPHARLAGVAQPQALFLQLDAPVAFDAPDGEPVDLFFALLVPEDADDEHLNVLAQIAELFSSAGTRNALRRATKRRSLYEVITAWQQEPRARESTG